MRLSDFDEKLIRHYVCVFDLLLKKFQNLFFIIISLAPFVSLPKGAFCISLFLIGKECFNLPKHYIRKKFNVMKSGRF